MRALILANLSKRDYKRFQKAKITYSGATGIGALPEDYNGIAPYIATYDGMFFDAVRAMKWSKFLLEITKHQILARRVR